MHQENMRETRNKSAKYHKNSFTHMYRELKIDTNTLEKDATHMNPLLPQVEYTMECEGISTSQCRQLF
jgi:hypothetical protein